MDIARQVMAVHFWASSVFGTFLVITSFILYSLVIAVVCDAVAVTEHQDDEEQSLAEKEAMRQKLTELQLRLKEMTMCQRATMAAVRKAMLALDEKNDDPLLGIRMDDFDDASEPGLGAEDCRATSLARAEFRRRSRDDGDDMDASVEILFNRDDRR